MCYVNAPYYFFFHWRLCHISPFYQTPVPLSSELKVAQLCSLWQCPQCSRIRRSKPAGQIILIKRGSPLMDHIKPQRTPSPHTAPLQSDSWNITQIGDYCWAWRHKLTRRQLGSVRDTPNAFFCFNCRLFVQHTVRLSFFHLFIVVLWWLVTKKTDFLTPRWRFIFNIPSAGRSWTKSKKHLLLSKQFASKQHKEPICRPLFNAVKVSHSKTLCDTETSFTSD